MEYRHILQHTKINKHKVAVSNKYSSQNFMLFLTTTKEERGHHAADGLFVVHIKHNLTFWWADCTLLLQSSTVKTYVFEYKTWISAVDRFVLQQICETCAMPNIYPLWWTFVIMKDLNWHQFLSGTLKKGIKIEINYFQNVRENQLIIYQNVLLLMFWRNSIWQAK
jgi:hypothetical protein